MRAALDSVRADAVFVRSPVLTRLLEFLVEQTLAGHGKTLKSYSIAVEGLGKSPDLDPQADTYARVAVARLRTALDTYYAAAGAQARQRLLIASGSYEVHLVDHCQAPRPAPSVRAALPNRKLMVAGLALFLVLLGLLLLWWREDAQAATRRWRTSNFPFVEVSVTAESGDAAGMELASTLRRLLIMKLDRYEGIRMAYNPSTAAAYAINVTIKKGREGYDKTFIFVEKQSNRVILFESPVAGYYASESDMQAEQFIARSTFYAASVFGAIHSNERKRNVSVDSPYGCWLYFFGLSQRMHTIGDETLFDCAEEWHSASPDHPVAAALYGWALTDRSISAFTDDGRKQTLREAIDVLESARAVNPDSPLLQVAAMRAFAYSGDGAAMRAAGARARELNPDSLDIAGMVGLMLALQNDPQGEVLLNKAIAGHFNPPAWYFVGTFVAAMMRDDPASAGRSVVRLRELKHVLPIQPIISAAYEARIGHLDQARAQWDQATAARPLLRAMPDVFLARLPIAPPVKRRLEQWLAPVIGDSR